MTNDQIPRQPQFPSPNGVPSSVVAWELELGTCLDLGIWDFFGVWCLLRYAFRAFEQVPGALGKVADHFRQDLPFDRQVFSRRGRVDVISGVSQFRASLEQSISP